MCATHCTDYRSCTALSELNDEQSTDSDTDRHTSRPCSRKWLEKRHAHQRMHPMIKEQLIQPRLPRFGVLAADECVSDTGGVGRGRLVVTWWALRVWQGHEISVEQFALCFPPQCHHAARHPAQLPSPGRRARPAWELRMHSSQAGAQQCCYRQILSIGDMTDIFL